MQGLFLLKKKDGNRAFTESYSYSLTSPGLPNEEIELSSNTGSSVAQGYYSSQKAATYPSLYTPKIQFHSVCLSLTGYTEVQLFDNTCLYYNYPSHNFW